MISLFDRFTLKLRHLDKRVGIIFLLLLIESKYASNQMGQLPPKYGIRGIPTMLLFKDGAVQATKVGALSKANLNAFLDSNI